MTVHYLVDYENVHEDGLAGISDVTVRSFVHIFYTRNACKINMDVLSDAGRTRFEFIKAASGSQSLDMHLVSFLGFLIGSERDPEDRYIVISRDNDFLNCISFWNRRTGVPNKVTKQPAIDPSVKDDETAGRRPSRSRRKRQTAKADASAKADPSAKADNPAKADAPAKSDNPAKADTSAKAEAAAAGSAAADTSDSAESKVSEPILLPGHEPKLIAQKTDSTAAADRSEAREDQQETSTFNG